MAHRKSGLLKDYYSGKNILVTGVSGFIGGVLLIKILSSLQDVGKVYVMVRPKKNLTGKQRLAQMLDKPAFSWFTEKGAQAHAELLRQDSKLSGVDFLPNEKLYRPLDWSRVVAVEGDLSSSGLGLSPDVRQELCDEVDVIFNIAASVRFVSPLKDIMEDNYYSVLKMLQLASECKHLDSFVHCSTIAVHFPSPVVEERVVPLSQDCENIARVIDYLPDSKLAEMKFEELEKAPNTYILSKAMAENYVQKFEGKLPLAIVRPSVVTPAIREPEPGWIDNLYGPIGPGILIALGLMRRYPVDYNRLLDVVPVDMVVNAMLAVGERTARSYSREIKVYNCTTTSLNPCVVGPTLEEIFKLEFEAPSIKVLRVPLRLEKHQRRLSKFAYWTGRISEALFAYFFDFILLLCGQKRFMIRLMDKLETALRAFEFGFYHQWIARDDNTVAAFEELDPADQQEFNFNFRNINWREYIRSSVYGSRRHLLKEDLSNLGMARFKFKVQYVWSSVSNYLLIGFTLWFGLRLCGYQRLFYLF